MLLTIEIIGLIFMLVSLVVIVWGFIIMNKIFSQLRYRNYLMEKISQNLYMISIKSDTEKLFKDDNINKLDNK